MQQLLERVHCVEAQIHNLGARLQAAVAHAPDQFFHAMRYDGAAVHSDLRGRAFHRVHRAEQPVDIFGVRIALERQQAFGYGLEMFLGFGDENFEHLCGNIAVLGKGIDE